MQIFLSIDPFLDKPKPSAMPDWDARRRFGVFFVGVSGLLWPVLGVTGMSRPDHTPGAVMRGNGSKQKAVSRHSLRRYKIEKEKVGDLVPL